MTKAANLASLGSVVTVPTGDAPSYQCRAWVNFNGTGTVAIRASGNVSSITDNAVGDYTVNMAAALVDANYSIVGWAGGSSVTANRSANVSQMVTRTTYTSSAVAIFVRDEGGTLDATVTCVAIFR